VSSRAALRATPARPHFGRSRERRPVDQRWTGDAIGREPWRHPEAEDFVRVVVLPVPFEIGIGKVRQDGFLAFRKAVNSTSFEARHMRLPRMTTRRWMIAVAIIGILMGGAILIGRHLAVRNAYLQRAALHEIWKGKIYSHPNAAAYWESRWRDQRIGHKGSYPWPDEPPFVPAIAEYHERMIAKWRYAADHPWREVEPDPVAIGP
jgi:hypothetical protein